MYHSLILKKRKEKRQKNNNRIHQQKLQKRRISSLLIYWFQWNRSDLFPAFIIFFFLFWSFIPTIRQSQKTHTFWIMVWYPFVSKWTSDTLQITFWIERNLWHGLLILVHLTLIRCGLLVYGLSENQINKQHNGNDLQHPWAGQVTNKSLPPVSLTSGKLLVKPVNSHPNSFNFCNMKLL